jgi:hypothetical protein
MFGLSRHERWKKKTIREFESRVKAERDKYMERFANGYGSREELTQAIRQVGDAILGWEQAIDVLKQEKLMARLEKSPLQVPPEYWFDTGVPYRRALTFKGQAWALHELKKLRNAEIEFWFKLVVPVAALIISVIALVRSGHSH